MDDRRDEIDFDVSPSITPSETTIDQSSTALALQLAGRLTGALSDPLGISFGDIYQSIKELISGDIDKVILSIAEVPLFTDFDKVGNVLDRVQAVLNAPIEIPFLTPLYRGSRAASN